MQTKILSLLITSSVFVVGCGKSDSTNPKSAREIIASAEAGIVDGVPTINIATPDKPFPPPPPMPVNEQFATPENLKIATWHLRAWVAAGNKLPEQLANILTTPNCPKPLPAPKGMRLYYDPERITISLEIGADYDANTEQ